MVPRKMVHLAFVSYVVEAIVHNSSSAKILIKNPSFIGFGVIVKDGASSIMALDDVVKVFVLARMM